MTVGVVGLGLIGGSMARAYKENGGNTVYGFDADAAILEIAQISGVIDGVLSGDTIKECECILLALYPEASIEYLEKYAQDIPKAAMVIDCCGTKRKVCRAGFEIAEKYGFTFVGGHPMAGTQYSGYKNSRSTMFKGASMIIVPPVYDDIELLARVKELLAPAGFGRITVTTAEKHDEMIAFTSQMAHIVSNAYIKSPTARAHKGFSAGSYKDLTRVARMNVDMWTELFLENRDNLIKEVDILIDELEQYRDAMRSMDRERLSEVLEEGSRIKQEVDGI